MRANNEMASWKIIYSCAGRKARSERSSMRIDLLVMIMTMMVILIKTVVTTTTTDRGMGSFKHFFAHLPTNRSKPPNHSLPPSPPPPWPPHFLTEPLPRIPLLRPPLNILKPNPNEHIAFKNHVQSIGEWIRKKEGGAK